MRCPLAQEEPSPHEPIPEGDEPAPLGPPGRNHLQTTRGGGEFGARGSRQHEVGSPVELLEAQLAGPGGPHQHGQGGVALPVGYRELLAFTQRVTQPPLATPE